MTEEPTGLRIPRAAWHARASIVVYAWLAAAVVVALLRDHLEDAAWLATHFALLGAVTNAIFIWSWHFTGAILRVPGQADRSDEVMRLVLLNAGAGGIIIGGVTSSPMIVLLSALFVVTAVVLLARAIRSAIGRALPSPYGFTAHAYVYALSLLVVGIVLGTVMETFTLDDDVKARLTMAHVTFNLFGFVGTTILGTIVTLWPTMLRTRIAPTAARLAQRVLPLLASATVVAALGYAINVAWVAALGVGAYLVGFGVTMVPIASVARSKRPTSFATCSTLAGLLWLAATLAWFAVALLRWGIVEVHDHGAGFVIGAVAGVLQVLLGSMSYLLPAMAGGGPAAVRARNERADRLTWPRLALTNLGLVGIVFAPDDARTPGTVAALAGFVWTALTVASTLPTPAPARGFEGGSGST